jgi:hypothetical protein
MYRQLSYSVRYTNYIPPRKIQSRIYFRMDVSFVTMTPEERLRQRQERRDARRNWFQGSPISMRRFELADQTAAIWEAYEDAILNALRSREYDAESRHLLKGLREAWEACHHKYTTLEAAATSDPEGCVAQLAGLHMFS